MTRVAVLVFTAAVAAVLCVASASAASFPVRLVSQDASTVTLGWDAQPGDGYRFSADGKVVSRTFDPSRTSVRFSKAASYSVEVLHVSGGDVGVYPAPVQPPPPTGNVLEITGTVTAASLGSQIAVAPAGPLTVKPPAGQSSFTVTGTFDLKRQNVTLQHVNLTDFGQIGADANGFRLEDCKVRGMYLDGVSGWTILRCDVNHQHVMDTWGNSGAVMYRTTNWQILDSTFHGHTVDADRGQHTEALYIGVGNNNGLIKGNTFSDGGSTAHIFFTWWDSSAGANDPKNICVTGNTFYPALNPYWFIDMRAELKGATNNIDIDPKTNTFVFQNGRPAQIANQMSWVRACS